jgi:hypothetical protein
MAAGCATREHGDELANAWYYASDGLADLGSSRAPGVCRIIVVARGLQ